MHRLLGVLEQQPVPGRAVLQLRVMCVRVRPTRSMMPVPRALASSHPKPHAASRPPLPLPVRAFLHETSSFPPSADRHRTSPSPAPFGFASPDEYECNNDMHGTCPSCNSWCQGYKSCTSCGDESYTDPRWGYPNPGQCNAAAITSDCSRATKPITSTSRAACARPCAARTSTSKTPSASPRKRLGSTAGITTTTGPDTDQAAGGDQARQPNVRVGQVRRAVEQQLHDVDEPVLLRGPDV